MAKKRKLNSKNPKYSIETTTNTPKVKERKLLCNAGVRNVNGDLVEGKTIPVYGVWYEND